MKYIPAVALILALSIPVQCPDPDQGYCTHFPEFEGNTLVGYGLVMGLNKTGDKKQTLFPQQTLVNMLAQFGLTLNGNIRVENIAGVIVTADLPAFARPGSPIDVTVSSIGDATSLQGRCPVANTFKRSGWTDIRPRGRIVGDWRVFGRQCSDWNYRQSSDSRENSKWRNGGTSRHRGRASSC
jgi:hypothetical protein